MFHEIVSKLRNLNEASFNLKFFKEFFLRSVHEIGTRAPALVLKELSSVRSPALSEPVSATNSVPPITAKQVWKITSGENCLGLLQAYLMQLGRRRKIVHQSS